MREIKFRAWDSSQYPNGMMIQPENLIGLDGLTTETLPPPLILMQFTGLKDKNGKEIYFDDIVERGGERFHVTYHKIAPSMIFKGIGNETHHNIIYMTSNEYEVIGNIHETPELCEKQ